LTNKKVLDVSGGRDAEGQACIVHGNHGKANQRWNVVYLDKAEKEQTEGMHEDFGFQINKPFYFRSRMPFRRIVEAHGNHHITLRRWRKNQVVQQWWFDGVSKTVRSQNWKGHAIEIISNGNGNDIRFAGVNSRWW
jgi:hypothetical protein